MSDPARMKYEGQFIDAESVEPVQEQGGCPVMFFLEPVEDEAASAAAGQPVYTDREFIRIIVPGDKENTPVRAVRDDDRRLYAAQYKAFKSRPAVPSAAVAAQQARAENDALRKELEALRRQVQGQAKPAASPAPPDAAPAKPKRPRARSKSTGGKPVAVKGGR